MLAGVKSSFFLSVTKKTGVKSKIPGPPKSDIVELDTHNFDEVALVCFFDFFFTYLSISHLFIFHPPFYIRIRLKMFW